MPRKLNLKIHTNIDDNFEILSSDQSSIISRLQEDTGDILPEVEKESFQATGETCIVGKESTQSMLNENLSEEGTMIVHKNVPSNENMLQFNDDSKNTEEDTSSEKKFKRNKQKVEIIQEASYTSNNFRRVESTSSFKRLPKLNT